MNRALLFSTEKRILRKLFPRYWKMKRLLKSSNRSQNYFFLSQGKFCGIGKFWKLWPHLIVPMSSEESNATWSIVTDAVASDVSPCQKKFCNWRIPIFARRNGTCLWRDFANIGMDIFRTFAWKIARNIQNHGTIWSYVPQKSAIHIELVLKLRTLRVFWLAITQF